MLLFGFGFEFGFGFGFGFGSGVGPGGNGRRFTSRVIYGASSVFLGVSIPYSWSLTSPFTLPGLLILPLPLFSTSTSFPSTLPFMLTSPPLSEFDIVTSSPSTSPLTLTSPPLFVIVTSPP